MTKNIIDKEANNKKEYVEKRVNCPFCCRFYEKNPFKEEWEKEWKEFGSRITKIKEIWKSSKDAYEKKIALFELVVNIDLEDIEPQENIRVNYLLRSRLYNELAKDNYDKYQKATVDEFTKKEKDKIK